jgi:hypothetical protein
LRPDDEQAMTDAIIKDRVRYAFLFLHKTDLEPKPGDFKIIGQSYLKDIIGGSAGMAGMATGASRLGTPTGGGETGATGGSAWEPLAGSGGGGQAGRGPGGGAAASGPKNPNAFSMAARSLGPRPGVPSAAPPPPPTTGAAKKQYPRTEFVIVFFWQEPTPSDQLMNLSAAPQPPTSPGR